MIRRIGTSAVLLVVALALAVGCTDMKKTSPVDKNTKIVAKQTTPKIVSEAPRPAAAGGSASSLVGKNVAVDLHSSAWRYYHPQFKGSVVSVDQTGLLLRRTLTYDKVKFDYKKALGTLYIPWTSIRHVLILKK